MHKLIEAIAVMTFTYFAFDFAGLVMLAVFIGAALVVSYLAVSDDAPFLRGLVSHAGLAVIVGVTTGMSLRVVHAAYVAMCRHVNAEADIAKAFQNRPHREDENDVAGED